MTSDKETAEIERRLNQVPIKKTFYLDAPTNISEEQVRAWLAEARKQIIKKCGIPNANS